MRSLTDNYKVGRRSVWQCNHGECRYKSSKEGSFRGHLLYKHKISAKSSRQEEVPEARKPSLQDKADKQLRTMLSGQTELCRRIVENDKKIKSVTEQLQEYELLQADCAKRASLEKAYYLKTIHNERVEQEAFRNKIKEQVLHDSRMRRERLEKLKAEHRQRLAIIEALATSKNALDDDAKKTLREEHDTICKEQDVLHMLLENYD